MKKYALIGKSLKHSFSKDFFTDYFLKAKEDSQYENIELATIDKIQGLKGQDYSGFNITIPYKEEIIPLLDSLSSEAKAIGAVNVVKIDNDNWIGYNTDAFGFHQLIKPFLTNKHERALVLGTGGASKAVQYVLKNLGIDIIFISRNPQEDNQYSYEEINKHMLNACKLIVNCTPVGTYPNTDEIINLPYSCLTDEHLVIDLIYNPKKTNFLKLAEENGASILNGQTMLIQQALKSREIWNQ